ncbi:MAG: hypothetical protein KatS3mg050_0959 [Litorilinea sp.]|nr:MAG: hypothetical protein KatS3mg050_0959 [Litorilinea sp.]
MMKQERIPLARGESWAASRGEGEGGRYTPLALLALCGFAFLMVTIVSVDEWPGLFLYLAVAGVLALGLYRRGIAPVDPGFPASLFLLALLLKWSSALVRYWTAMDLYGGAADALLYHYQGQFVAQYFRDLDFSLFTWYQARGEGTTNLVYLTGVIYTFLPPSFPGAFLLFASLAFAGSVLFYRSMREAVPGASPTVYRWLIFFLPSILFWPASLGKDAWIFFCSGLVAWGWAVFARRTNLAGLGWTAAGLAGIVLIRPHIAAFMAMAMAAGYILYGIRHVRHPLIWLAGGLIIGFTVLMAVRAGQDFLNLDALSLDSIQEFYFEQQESTMQGGSRFVPPNVFTPAGAIYGLVTVMARPFPWEAHNAQALLTSLETLCWIFFCWAQRGRFVKKVRELRADPFAGFALTYSLILMLALTSIGNFGILVRQRVMFLPFFWLLFV